MYFICMISLLTSTVKNTTMTVLSVSLQHCSSFSVTVWLYLTCQKIQEGHTMVQFRVEFASASWPSQSHR